ncbi:MAG TPA: alpha-glucan family phosphorylase [Acidimicrobiia bacterium]|nr:alpha-glucan family phosphorylase [Acidimicrobiia bacterium]
MNPETIRSWLVGLARNYRWTWSPETKDLFARLPKADPSVHPVLQVAALEVADFESIVADGDLAASIEAEAGSLEALLADSTSPRIAYCSPEFGLSALLPQYAGGLGVLAGDHLKSASDLGTPLAGVGLFYGEGVFRQVIEDGRQTERYDVVAAPDVGATDTGLIVEIPFPGRDVQARVWRIDVGRVPLLLLDTDVDGNTDDDRKITDRLYAGSRQHRLEQEIVLGVGGARALAALGWEIELHHLNEGHAGFIVLELIDRICAGIGMEAAVKQVRDELVFTTHTPVPAGIDRFDAETVRPYLQPWVDRWEVPLESIWELGEDPEDPTMFNMAALCLRTARTANGVSQLHGEVSRQLFAGVGIGDDIGHITNGVHARTWTGPHTQQLFDSTLGQGWADGSSESWDRVSLIDGATLGDLRRRSSLALAELIRARTGDEVDPDALIIGFARRFAPYKRASLLLRRPDLLEKVLADDSRPVHFVFAGKAHPSDETGKGLVADLISAGTSPAVNGRLTFIPDYEMDIAMAMVQGSDIWLNNPIRPREASGTSGEKAVLNGSLNCSVLDGWWAEMYDGHNGWEITPSPAEDPGARDHEEATTMLETIAEVVAEYHDARPLFLGRIRHAWRTLGPKVTSARMVRDYEQKIYQLATQAP